MHQIFTGMSNEDLAAGLIESDATIASLRANQTALISSDDKTAPDIEADIASRESFLTMMATRSNQEGHLFANSEVPTIPLPAAEDNGLDHTHCDLCSGVPGFGFDPSVIVIDTEDEDELWLYPMWGVAGHYEKPIQAALDQAGISFGISEQGGAITASTDDLLGCVEALTGSGMDVLVEHGD